MLRKALMASVAPVIIMSAIAGGASAQTAPAAPAPAAPGAGTTTTLGEIIVTAQHRSENLQHAAISVDAVSGANLTKAGITDATSLSSAVPGLAAPAFGGGTVSYFIRGVGNFSEEPFGDPAVAFNYDGVYIGLPVETAQPFYDLQRVEVLKGPQGTLYGRNATGGAINVIPQTPQLNRYGGYATVSAGNYSAYNLEGAVNMPIGDNTAIRLAGNVIEHSGYMTQGMSDEDTKSLRAQIYSHLTPKLSVRVAADYTDVGGVGTGSNLTGYYTAPVGSYGSPATAPPAVGTSFIGASQYTFHPSNFNAATSYQSPASEAFQQGIPGAPAGRDLPADTQRPFTNNKLYGVNAEITYDTDYGLFTLIPAWRTASVGFGYGTIATPAVTGEDASQESVELRFAGKRISIFNYTLGAMYFHQAQNGYFNIDQGPIDVFQTFDTTTDSYAGFGRVTTNFTDQLRLVTGFRYTVDEKSFNGVSTALTLICTPNSATGCPTAPSFPYTTTPGQLTGLLAEPATDGAFPIGAHLGTPPINTLLLERTDTVVDASRTFTAPTFRVALEYDVTPRSLLYASVETGYRSGGFNLAAATAANPDDVYKPELITAFTLGSKNRFMENKLELNAELFLWKYHDQQVSHLTEDALGDNNNLVQNVGASTNEGVEVEGRYLVTRLTNVTANVQYLDAHYDRFNYLAQSPNAAAPNTACLDTYKGETAGAYTYSVNCSGKTAFNSPKWTLNFGVEQTIPLEGFNLLASANTQYLSSRYIAFDYLPQEEAPAVWQTSAQLALAPDAGRWTFTLFCQNLENVRYAVNDARLPTGDFIAQTTTPPRTYGARLNVKF